VTREDKERVRGMARSPAHESHHRAQVEPVPVEDLAVWAETIQVRKVEASFPDDPVVCEENAARGA
jgi:3'-phosphoadenosine 5'-phosphosulfate (PAPS) 3'-phosphatase